MQKEVKEALRIRFKLKENLIGKSKSFWKNYAKRPELLTTSDVRFLLGVGKALAISINRTF